VSGSNIITGTLDLLVLRILEGGARHGYAVGREIREGSAGVLDVEEGVLYPALHRLEERGLLKSRWHLSETGRRAKFYELTRSGRTSLEEAVREWDSVTGAVGAILRGGAAS